MLNYTMSVVGSRLIDSDVTVPKHFRIELLSGGFQDRFIPSLSDETKRQIEGSFKITGD